MTTADTLGLRESLLKELRCSPAPLSTAELAQRMPWKVERSHVPCAQLCDLKRLGPGIRIMECHTDWHVVAYRRTTHGYTGVYRHLRSLEGHGLIRRTIRDGRKRVCWTLVEQTALPDPAAATTAVSDRGELVDDDASEEPQTASAHMVAC
ncbi:hypothetical protein [Mycobacterium avium]|uniref:hypothetical protein n=1 Tax=Mycobacterium avium TaxID=1764 RepID=UPI000B4BCA96|nr:hypothetical protein [Mycobacterium avium]